MINANIFYHFVSEIQKDYL